MKQLLPRYLTFKHTVTVAAVSLLGLFSPLVSRAQDQIFTPLADAQVYQGNAANNYANSDLQIKKTPESSNTRVVYLKFDLSSYSLNQTGTAILRLYLRTNDRRPRPVIIEALKVEDSNWQESTVNWNNRPVYSSSVGTCVLGDQGNYYEWNITDYVKSFNPSAQSNTVFSIALKDPAESDALLNFNSKENANYKPQLLISEQARPNQSSGSFYVDALNGNDSNDGTSPENAWKTLQAPSNRQFAPGSQIRFKSGQTFQGTLIISSSGSPGNPVTYETYGGANHAIIDGTGNKLAVYAYNKSYIELKNFSITNHRNTTITNIDQFLGLAIINENAGTLNHIYLDGLKVYDVNSSDDVDKGGTKNHGGVFFNVMGTYVQSKWNDVLIKNCVFEDLSRTGLNFESEWELRNSNTSYGDDLGDGRKDNWTPSTNVVIKDNIFRNIAGNGLVVRVAVNPLIETNFFDYCGKTVSGNAAFNFNTDGAIFQYNEAMRTVYNEGDTDARGIDSDFRTKDTYIQYNYLHDNGFGGVVATGGNHETNPPSIPERFNTNTVIRFNIVENNNRQAVAFSGNMKSAEVYNNVFYADANHNDITIVRLAQWSAHPKNIRFRNNIFSFSGTGNSYSFTSGSSYSFNKNLFYTSVISSEPADAGKVKADPLFLAPGSSTNGYKLMPGSPALHSGVIIEDQGGRDYYNNLVSSTSTPNIGAYNGPGTNTLPIKLESFTARKLTQGNILNWVTASEINNSFFEIERSEDGQNFSVIAKITGAGNSNIKRSYSSVDMEPAKGMNYYRLKQTDLDGQHSYSLIVPLDCSLVSSPGKLVVYPNPTAGFINLAHQQISAEQQVIQIYDIRGRLSLTKAVNSREDLQVDVSTLVRGIYVLKLKNDKETIAESKFLKL